MTIQDVIRDLTGDHPWIPGAHFKTIPGLQEYLLDAVKEFNAAPVKANRVIATSQLVGGDKIRLKDGTVKEIVIIRQVYSDIYDIYFSDDTNEYDIPGDVQFNLAELRLGIDF